MGSLFISGVSLSIAVNMGISALPFLVGAKDAAKLRQAKEDDTQDIKWGVMSLLSFFPLLNWLVRVQPFLEIMSSTVRLTWVQTTLPTSALQVEIYHVEAIIYHVSAGVAGRGLLCPSQCQVDRVSAGLGVWCPGR